VLFDSNALTKVQSAILGCIILVASVAGGVAYFYWKESNVSEEIIRIGVCGDLDCVYGAAAWQGALLAAEQVNAEGGVLGKAFEIVAEDDDSESQPFDVAVATNALIRLITVDKADFILSSVGVPLVFQDICADHRIILFSGAMADEMAQRVADNYTRYKGFFRAGIGNVTSAINGMADSILTLRDYTGFNKVAILAGAVPAFKVMMSGVTSILLENDFDVVYDAACPIGTIDFSSYYAAVESSGAEVLVPMIMEGPCVPFVKEYRERRSPFVVWGGVGLAQNDDFWDLTGGGCESVSFVGYPIVSGYPLSSKTVSTREAYIDRWGKVPSQGATSAYDLVRFILPDAIRRAGTIEYEAMIKALEKTDVETSLARRFVFTSDHDIMVGAAGPNRPGEDYLLVCLFQWQDGKQVLVYPKELMEEAGATYIYPDWPGPWD
jgi:branched-chain amino acid transport system substrate-binding protein